MKQPFSQRFFQKLVGMEGAFPGGPRCRAVTTGLLTGAGYWNVRTLSLLVISVLSLVVPIRPLLGWLGWSRLCWSIAPILLTLTLRIIRILRTWTALGRTVALLLAWVALLPRVLLLLGWVSLLWRWSLVSVLLLAVL